MTSSMELQGPEGAEEGIWSLGAGDTGSCFRHRCYFILFCFMGDILKMPPCVVQAHPDLSALTSAVVSLRFPSPGLTPCLASLACKLLLVTVCGRNVLNSCLWAYIFFLNVLLVRSYPMLSRVSSVVSASLHTSSEQWLLLNFKRFATWAEYLFGVQILLWRK